MILLDTDIMIDLLRKYPPAIAWLSSLGDEEIALPGFVVMELIHSQLENRATLSERCSYERNGLTAMRPDFCGCGFAKCLPMKIWVH